MTQLNRGIKFDSSNSASPAVTSIATLSNSALLSADFFSGSNGAAVFTLTPALRPGPGLVTLIEGYNLDMALEYDNANQVRLVVTTGGDTYFSAWFAAGAEHTVGISYQTPQYLSSTTLLLSVDGNNKKEIGVGLVSDAAGTANRSIMPAGEFDGLLSQVAIFKDALTEVEIKTMTGDAAYLGNTLSKLTPSSTVSGVTNTPTLSAGTATTDVKINLGGTYNVGDSITVSYNGLTASYVVVTADKPSSATDAIVRNNVTNKLLLAMQAKFAPSYTLVSNTAGNTPYISLTDSSATATPNPSITFINAANFRESALDAYLNFSKSALTYETTPTANLNALKFVTANAGDLLGFYDAAAATTKLAPIPINGTLTVSPTVTPQAGLPNSGPFYAELVSYAAPANAGTGGNARYQIFIDPSYDTLTPGAVKSMGLTVQLDPSSGSLTNLASLTPNNLNPITNIYKSGNAATMQWFTQNATGLTDYRLPVAEVNVQLPALNAGELPKPSINLTFSEMSLDGRNFTTASTSSQPLATVETILSQVYSVTGSVKQYTSNATGSNGTANTFGPNNGAIKGASVVYQVYDDASKAPAKMQLTMPGAVGNKSVYPTASAPDADLYVSVSIQKPSAISGVTGYNMTIELPSNCSSKPVFTPNTNTAFTVTSSSVNGRMLNIVGTFTATAGNDTDLALGTINLKLSNAYAKTETINFNNVSLTSVTGTVTTLNPTSGRDLSFGTVQTDANGSYRIENLPKGQIFPAIMDTVDKAALVSGATPLITTDDAYKVLMMATGRKNGTNDWLPSDYIAADYNRDGVVTAEDALLLLNYAVSTNKSAPSMAFFSYDANLVGMNKSSVTVPPLDNTFTYQDLSADATQSTFIGLGDGPTLNFVGVLIGDIQH